MHRAIKAADKLSDRKYRAYCRRLHLKRLKNVKPSIDNKAPKRCPHLRQNLKKKQLMEERFATIERENQLLLEKMSAIMNKNCLDNKNDSLRYAHSMNKGRRKKDLEKITRENQAILYRIQAREPTYNHMEWKNERERNLRYLQNISEYEIPISYKPPRRLKPLEKDYTDSSAAFLDAEAAAAAGVYPEV